MELVILGTAAAESWPAPFCLCPACEEARRRGGPNLRSRSGALIDDDLKIDFNADTVLHMQRSGRNLSGVHTLLFTHQHSDHVVASELEWTARPYTLTPPAAIEVRGNRQVLEQVRGQFGGEGGDTKNLDLRPMEAGDHFVTDHGDEVWAMPADHVTGATVLRIRRGGGTGGGGKTVFYGHDSGLYPAATLDTLGDGIVLDIALLDCTNGGAASSNRGHMGVGGIVRMTDELRRRGAIADHTRVIATHFSHNGGLLHEELVAALVPRGIEVAFDGMVVSV